MATPATVAASPTHGCRLVADTFLEVVDDLGTAAMSDEMAEVLTLG